MMRAIHAPGRFFGRFFRVLAHPRWGLTSPRGLAAWFLLCALPTGLGCALLAPIGMFPDEFAHAARADALRHGEIFGVKPPPNFPDFMINQGVMVDTGIFGVLFSKEFIHAFPDKPVRQEDRLLVRQIPWIPGFMYFPSQMVEYFPLLYSPAALALLAGQAVGVMPDYAFYAGRVAMLLAFLAAGAAAIGLARTGNGLLFTVLTLPTTINLASSYNQDGLLIALFALAAGLLTRRDKSWGLALALLLAGICAKTPYVALFGFCLPPLVAPGLPRRVALVALACVPPALWLLHCTHAGFIAYQRDPYTPGPLWPGAQNILFKGVDPHANLRVLLAHPLQMLWLPLHTLILNWHISWTRLLGMVSCDTVLIWPWEYPLLAVSFLAALCGSLVSRPVAGWQAGDAWFAALALFGAFTGMELSMYLTFTKVGLGWIEGVQPRYYLPLLPFLVFLLPWAGRFLRLGTLPHPTEGWFALPACAMALVNAIALPLYIHKLFQMAGP